MEKMDNKIIKILIPVIAVVIIFESVVLVSNLEKNNDNTSVAETPTTAVETKTKVNSFDLNISTDGTQMKIGKKYKVSVNLTPKENYSLNAFDLYIKFDPAMVSVSGLTALKDLSTPDLIKVSDKKNVVALSYLFTAKDGQAFVKDKVSTVLTFMVTPKAEGNNFVYRKDKKYVALIGVEDLMVIDSGDALLITRKDKTGKVGEVFDKLKEEGRNDLS
jgi:hypothetical protein